jgi:DNA ligase-1
MLYKELCNVYERLEKTTKKLEKRDILAELYKKCEGNTLYQIVLLSMGIVYPAGQDLGIAENMMKEIICRSYGVSEKELEEIFKKTGDLGLTAEHFADRKKQVTLFSKNLLVENVFQNLRKVAETTGEKSQEKKMSYVAELLTHAKGIEARYITRTVLGELRIGVAAGIVRDAIAKAFNKSPEEIEKSYNVLGDFGMVAKLAKENRLGAEIRPGIPVRVMLAERAPDLKTALEEFENCCLEAKYDGFRVCVHKDGNKITLFSRRLENVTNQFPEIVEWSRSRIKAESAIIEGEAIAIDLNTKSPLPFQFLSRRIQRKYSIEEMMKEIPVQVNLFDIIYLNGENLMNKKLKERWEMLKNIIEENERFKLAEHIETKDFSVAEKFYKECLSKGYEGVIVKNLDAHYQPGKRVGYWLKVKPIMEPLDLVIVGAEWGEGKRAKFLGSLILAAFDPKTKKFLPTGMMGSGLTDDQLKEITEKLKPLIIKEEGRIVEIKPKIVVEVGYEEIQKSPKYPTGYALRFPRLIRFRDQEKTAEEADTIETIEKLFYQQKKRRVEEG